MHLMYNPYATQLNRMEPSYGRNHSWSKIILIVATVLLFIIIVIFNGLTSNKNLFKLSPGDVSDKYYTEFTPAGWVFIIWAFIYTWQGLWLLYSISCIFRKTSNGSYLYLSPDFLNSAIFIVFIVNLCANITWLFLWGFEHLGWALLAICIIMLTLYGILFISHRKLNQTKNELRSQNSKKEVWLVRMLIQNGIAFYATWISIASILNFVIYISWRLNANLKDSSTAGLCLIISSALMYSILENIIWPHYLLYTFSPWIVIIVAFIGILTKNWRKGDPTRNNIISLIILILAVLLALLKIIFFILYKTVLRNRVRTLRN